MRNFGQKIDGIEGLYEAVGKLTSYEERTVSVAGVDQERYKAIVPDDGSEIAMSIVSKDYVLIQHERALRPMMDAIKEVGSPVTGWVNQHKGRAFLSIQIKDRTLSVDGDQIGLGFTFTNSVDKSSSLSYELFGLRLVCANGMVGFGKVLGGYHAVHYGDAQKIKRNLKMQLLSDLTNASDRLRVLIVGAMQEEVEGRLAELVYSNAGFGDRQIQKILGNLKTQDIYTGWDLYNAATEWLSHEKRKANIANTFYQGRKALQLLHPIALTIKPKA